MFGNMPIKVDYSSCSQGPNPVYAIISLDPLSRENWRSHSCIKVKVVFVFFLFFFKLAVITINICNTWPECTPMNIHGKKKWLLMLFF